jgi:hypothetical protein
MPFKENWKGLRSQSVGECAILQKVTINFVMFIRLSARQHGKKSALTGQIMMTVCI